LPLDRQRPVVADVVERHDDLFEVDVAAADAAEVPVAARVAEGGVAPEDTDGAVAAAPPRVYHVHEDDAGPEPAQEAHVIDALVTEGRGEEVEAERRMNAQRS